MYPVIQLSLHRNKGGTLHENSAFAGSNVQY